MDRKKLLLEVYKQGFTDSFISDPTMSRLITKAYQLGWNHSIIGDDLRSVDYLSEDEIIELILKE